MTDDSDRDINDLHELFSDRTPIPKDVVPKSVTEDSLPVPSGPGIAVTDIEITEHGVTRTETTAFVTAPIYPKGHPHARH